MSTSVESPQPNVLEAILQDWRREAYLSATDTTESTQRRHEAAIEAQTLHRVLAMIGAA